MPSPQSQHMSALHHINIVKNIEKDCATFEQWAQLSKDMVSALPWCLLQKHEDELAAAEAELVKKLAEEEDASSNEGIEDQGIQWNHELGWTFKTLVEPDKPSQKHDKGVQDDGIIAPQPSPTKQVEKEVLAYIATIHVCEIPYPHECPQVLTSVPRRVSRRRRTRNRVEAFRDLREFSESQFGNGTSMLRHGLPADEVNEGAATNKNLVKLDPSRLANSWDERFDAETGKYDMTGIQLHQDASGQTIMLGPKRLAEEEY
jgi:hypothetical protein